jgi:hypothetical protein
VARTIVAAAHISPEATRSLKKSKLSGVNTPSPVIDVLLAAAAMEFEQTLAAIA